MEVLARRLCRAAELWASGLTKDNALKEAELSRRNVREDGRLLSRLLGMGRKPEAPERNTAFGAWRALTDAERREKAEAVAREGLACQRREEEPGRASS